MYCYNLLSEDFFDKLKDLLKDEPYDKGLNGKIYIIDYGDKKLAVKYIKNFNFRAFSEVDNFLRTTKMKEYYPYLDIINIHGLCIDNNDIYIVMDYVPLTLNKYYKDDFKALQIPENLRKIIDLGFTLTTLHKMCIYHRDIHGGNILLDVDNNNNIKNVYLIDFGASFYSVEYYNSEYRLSNLSKQDNDLLNLLLSEKTYSSDIQNKILEYETAKPELSIGKFLTPYSIVPRTVDIKVIEIEIPERIDIEQRLSGLEEFIKNLKFEKYTNSVALAISFIEVNLRHERLLSDEELKKLYQILYVFFTRRMELYDYNNKPIGDVEPEHVEIMKGLGFIIYNDALSHVINRMENPEIIEGEVRDMNAKYLDVEEESEIYYDRKDIHILESKEIILNFLINHKHTFNLHPDDWFM